MKGIHTITIFFLGLTSGWLIHEWANPVPKQTATVEKIIDQPIVVNKPAPTQAKKTAEKIRPLSVDPEFILLSLLQKSQFQQAITFAQRQRIGIAPIRQYARQLMDLGQLQTSINLLILLTDEHVTDIESLELLAQAYLKHKRTMEAITTLKRAYKATTSWDTKNQLTEKINDVILQQEAKLISLGDFKRLYEFYRQLVNLDPSQPLYLLKLAQAQVRLNRYEQAYQTLGLIIYDPDVSTQARQLLEKIEKKYTQGKPAAKIALEKQGNHFFVPVTVGNYQIKLMIDTGATITALDPAVLQDLEEHVSYANQSRVFHTAGGPIQASIFQLDSAKIGDYTVETLEVGAIPFNRMDGLLGMNFLNQFEFYIDQENHWLLLTPKIDTK